MRIQAYRDNIMKVLDAAYDREIEHGLGFYQNWNSLARMLFLLFGLPTVEHGAGILAALSPRNYEFDNISHAFMLCRTKQREGIRNTDANVNKALRIVEGEHPEHVLSGRKVRSFYAAIASPNLGMSIPVDRHLCCAAVGKVMGDHEITRTLSKEYGRIEDAFFEIGNENKITGLSVSSVVWFVWRRSKKIGFQMELDNESEHHAPLFDASGRSVLQTETWPV